VVPTVGQPEACLESWLSAASHLDHLRPGNLFPVSFMTLSRAELADMCIASAGDVAAWPRAEHHVPRYVYSPVGLNAPILRRVHDAAANTGPDGGTSGCVVQLLSCTFGNLVADGAGGAVYFSQS